MQARQGLRRSWAIQLKRDDDAAREGLRRSWAIQLKRDDDAGP